MCVEIRLAGGGWGMTTLVELLERKAPVEIRYNNEAGVWQWSVSDVETGFWFDSFGTKREALAYCRKKGLKVERVENDKVPIYGRSSSNS
jgi:hypothetical protein